MFAMMYSGSDCEILSYKFSRDILVRGDAGGFIYVYDMDPIPRYVRTLLELHRHVRGERMPLEGLCNLEALRRRKHP